MTRKQSHTRRIKGHRIVINPRISKLFKFAPGNEVIYLKDRRVYVVTKRGRFARTYFLASHDNRIFLENIPENLLVTTL